MSRRLLVAATVVAPVIGLGAGVVDSSGATSAPLPVLSRRFAATGGRIAVRVAVAGRRPCRVELATGGGRLLSTGYAGPGVAVLSGRASVGEPVEVVLHPAVRRGFAWQVIATGVRP